ncbi:MAG: hypothetical protein JSR18_10625 [Proteobacteria bacterium]|nr:hypothetical protein [Pseudomonadota bacterium]
MSPAWVGMAAVVVCALAYATLHRFHADAGAAVSESPLPVATPQAPAHADVPVPALLPASTAGPAVVDPLVQPAVPDAPPPVAHPAPRRKLPPPAPVPSVRAEPPAPVAPTPPPVVAAVTPKPTLPPPALDRPSRVRAAFAACTQADVMARALCQQQARVDFCDGYWGQLPQCPAQRDYGN